MSLKHLADDLAARGRYGDTELVHMTKGEVAGLQSLAQAAGGSLTINPDTGKPEAFFLAALLPTILGGVGASMGLGALGTAALGAGVGALGAKAQGRNPLMGAIMGGMGGYGGGNIANALTSAAAPAATAQAIANPALAGAPVATGGTSQAAMLAAQNAGFGLDGAQLLAQAAGGTAPTATGMLGQGLSALGTEAGRNTALQSLGGGMGALKSASMAAAPMMYESMMPKPVGVVEEEEDVLPRYDYTAGLTGDYYGMGGDNSTRERSYFTQPTFTRRAAQGGIMQLAEGGDTDPKDPAQGMTGASADAMRYLMGQTNASPATVAQQNAIKAAEAARAAPQGFLAADKVAQYDPNAAMRPGLFGVGRKPQPGEFFSGSESGRDGYGGWGATPIGMAGEMLDGKKDEMPRFSYDPMTQRYTKLAAGGIASLASGGMKSGGFVVPADVVSMVGEGNTDAGYERIKRMLPGATPIKGKDGGQADTVKTSIEGKQPARVAHGEMYVPPATVKRAGGAKKLYAMMDKVRKQAKGDTKQIKPVDLRKALA